MSDIDLVYIVDGESTTLLDDVGEPEYVATVCVATDGSTLPVLAHIPDLNGLAPLNTDWPAHELAGPLPGRWVDRIALAPNRCGRQTKAGRRCRALVGRPNATCARHRELGNRA